jgi:hypothetical protein
VEGRLLDPEAGLTPDVQVPDDLDRVLELQVCLVFAAAAVAAAVLRQRPGDLEAVAVGVALLGGDGYPRRQIEVDRDGGHGRPGPTSRPRGRVRSLGDPSSKTSRAVVAAALADTGAAGFYGATVHFHQVFHQRQTDAQPVS